MSQDEIRDEGPPNLMSPDAIARRQRQTEEMEAHDRSQTGRRASPTSPPATLDDDAAALDASIRMKRQRGEALDDEEEKRFLASLPEAQRHADRRQMRQPPDED